MQMTDTQFKETRVRSVFFSWAVFLPAVPLLLLILKCLYGLDYSVAIPTDLLGDLLIILITCNLFIFLSVCRFIRWLFSLFDLICMYFTNQKKNLVSYYLSWRLFLVTHTRKNNLYGKCYLLNSSFGWCLFIRLLVKKKEI